MSNKKANIFSKIPSDLSEEIFEDIIKTDTLKIERIISYGQISPQKGWYDSNQNEWVILLDGEAKLQFEDNKQIHLQKGDYINITAHSKHKVVWTKENATTIWLAIYY